MRLHEAWNIDSEIYWMSKEINHGDWPFRFVLKLEYPGDWDAEAEKQLGKYHLELLAVSPAALKAAGNWDAQPDTNIGEYVAAIMNGQCAHLWQQSGNNRKALLAAGRKELKLANVMFGFYMDKRQNAIGATGWDWISGHIRPQKDGGTQA